MPAGPIACAVLFRWAPFMTRSRRSWTATKRFAPTSFGSMDLPAQIINSPNAPEIPSIDLSRLPEASRMAEAQRFFDAESWYRFESAVDPLFRYAAASPGRR